MTNAFRTAVAGLLMVSGAALAQTSTPSNMAKDDLFAGTEKFSKGATEVTELNMDQNSLNNVSGRSASRAHKMVLNVVRTYGYDKPGMYNIADVEAIRNRLNTGEWHCSVHTQDLKHGESTDICNRQRTDNMVETAIITVEPKELTFIHTIKQADGAGGGATIIDGLSPLGPTSGAWQAEMAVMRAEMAAQMAGMKPLMMGNMANLRAQMPGLQTWSHTLRTPATPRTPLTMRTLPMPVTPTTPLEPVTPPAPLTQPE